MTRTTPPRPLDLPSLFPELAKTARTVTRLHPRSGSPTVRDSSVGGPLLWPRDEPWPTCRQTHEVDEVWDLEASRAAHHAAVAIWSRPEDEPPTPEEQAIRARNHPRRIDSPYTDPVPMLPVAQLYARDVPDLPCPDGTDLLQVLWCPFMDHDDDTPAVRLRLRRADRVTAVVSRPPQPPVVELEEYVPAPCVLHPEQVIEYPGLVQLPAVLNERVRAWQDATGHHYNELSTAPGWRVGGWGASPWREEEPAEPVRCGCGAEALPLFTLGMSEWHGRDSGGWRPLEDADAGTRRCHPPVGDPTTVDLGDEQMQIHRCPVDSRHPPVIERVY
jgi:hypothetical protein